MLYACTASLLLIIGCVLFHYEALRFIGATAAGMHAAGTDRPAKPLEKRRCP